ncbi:MAG TPA: FAD binding domain-containing protein [Acidobacteriaceae bacterium]|nr:FAD binding domain-containing protein [Acidobacteriaceae bacterium]
MRSNVTEYDLIAPATLPAALAALAENPGRYTPIAGGTELMVALSAGRLAQRQLLSLHKLRELRFIDVLPDSITIGAGTTFTDLRKHPVIASDFALLARAGSWLGSIANQNRATIGGNIVNASPAADSPPALLVYEAQVTLVSNRGARTIPYDQFHLSYKKTVLEPGELLFSISLPRRFGAYRSYIRKVGTRNAQAISKIALAGLALISEGKIADIRLGAASLREVPTRCIATEQALLNQTLSPESLPALIASARAALANEVRPIDDIRSTARYRAAVAANLLEEFLRGL